MLRELSTIMTGGEKGGDKTNGGLQMGAWKCLLFFRVVHMNIIVVQPHIKGKYFSSGEGGHENCILQRVGLLTNSSFQHPPPRP